MAVEEVLSSGRVLVHSLPFRKNDSNEHELNQRAVQKVRVWLVLNVPSPFQLKLAEHDRWFLSNSKLVGPYCDTL
jgi:hypothetical protein